MEIMSPEFLSNGLGKEHRITKLNIAGHVVYELLALIIILM